MINKLYLFIFGYYFVTVEKCHRSVAADVLRDLAVTCLDAHEESSGEYTFKIGAVAFRRIKNRFDTDEICFKASMIRGLPAYIKRLIRRPGILLGLIASIALIHISSNVIWCYNITGNERLGESEVISILSEYGCGYGDRIGGIDFDRLHSRILAESDDISFISINMKGSHANVEIREKRIGKSTKGTDGLYANVVAGENGQIISCEANSGTGEVKEGQIVKKGELLISGVMPIRESEFRLEYAKGEVLAYVNRSCEAEIPLNTTEKRYTGEENTKKSVKIFKKLINISLKGGIEYTTYDKIVVRERVSLLGVIPLPIWIESCTYREYVNRETSLSSSDAVSAARAELRRKMDEAIGDASLVSSRLTTEAGEDSVRIKCEMKCIADIGRTIEFTAD